MEYRGYNTMQLDEKGYGMCTSCRRKKFTGDLEICFSCDKFVCKDCAKYIRQYHGWVCKRCKIKL